MAQENEAVIVIDALNQLEDREGARELVWLPENIPDNVRLIVSALPGPSLKELERRGWLDTALRVKPLEENSVCRERSTFIQEYLENKYAKHLSDNRVLRIASAEQCSNPLFLRAMLEELRQFGVHQLLDQRIDLYLQARDVPELFGMILSRWETDYEEVRPGLVHDSMTLIWASRKGLSEDELLELLGANGRRLPRAYWSPLSLASDGSLVNHGGFLAFSPDFIRNAITYKYLREKDDQIGRHRHLATFFRNYTAEERKLEETPWQYVQAGDFDSLESVLADPEYFLGLSFRDRYELWDYWHKRPTGRKSPVEIYRESLDAWERALDPERLELALNELTHFCNVSKDEPAQIEFAKRAFNIAKALYKPDDIRLAIRKNNLSHACFLEGNFGEALRLSREAQPAYEAHFDAEDSDRWVPLNNQGYFLLRLGKLEEAVKQSQVAYDGCSKNLGRWHHTTIAAAGNLAAALQLVGRFGEATVLFEETLEGHKRIFGPENPWTEAKRQMLEEHLRDFGDSSDHSAQMIDLGMKREAHGFPRLAAESYRRALELLDEEHAPPTDPGQILASRNLVTILCDLRDFKGARRVAKRLLGAEQGIFNGRSPRSYSARLRLALFFALRRRLDIAKRLAKRKNFLVKSTAPDSLPEVEIRSAALAMYNQGRYKESRGYLEALLQRNWQLASSHCHLARLGLVTDDIELAKQHAALAWQHRVDAEPYITPRILWIELAICTLEGDDHAASRAIAKLKMALGNRKAVGTWAMAPVLSRLSLKLPSPTHDLLTALVGAINGSVPLVGLDRFADWARAEPVPFENQ